MKVTMTITMTTTTTTITVEIEEDTKPTHHDFKQEPRMRHGQLFDRPTRHAPLQH